MKNKTVGCLLLSVMLFAGLSEMAADFTDGYMSYQITGEDDVSLLGFSDEYPKFVEEGGGEIVVPSVVEYNGK